MRMTPATERKTDRDVDDGIVLTNIWKGAEIIVVLE
jgi:hypothetical protein